MGRFLFCRYIKKEFLIDTKMAKIMWLGDSQTVSKNLPKGVSSGSGYPINFFGKVSATPTSYINGGNPHKVYAAVSSISALNGKLPIDAFNYTINNHFDVVIIALGHNSCNSKDYQTMINKLKQNGVKRVILVKMFPLATLPKDKLNARYGNISGADIIDVLLNEKVAVSDGTHAKSDEATRIGKLVGQKLKQILGNEKFTLDDGNGVIKESSSSSSSSSSFNSSGGSSGGSCFNLAAAYAWAKGHEDGMHHDCTGGVSRIMKAAGYNMSSGWYYDPWSNNKVPTGKSCQERAGFKVFALGETILDIRTLSGEPYVPEAGDIATYYGGLNPLGHWFQMEKGKKYKCGELYHTTCFLGDNIGWWSDGAHGHLDRPYKGLDCYYGVTTGGHPSTHVTIYRLPCVTPSLHSDSTSSGSSTSQSTYTPPPKPVIPDNTYSPMFDTESVQIYGGDWDVFEDFSKLLDEVGDEPLEEPDEVVKTPDDDDEDEGQISTLRPVEKDIKETTNKALATMKQNEKKEEGAVAGKTSENEVNEIMAKSENAIAVVENLNVEKGNGQSSDVTEDEEGGIELSHGKCPVCGKEMRIPTRDGFCSPQCAMKQNLANLTQDIQDLQDKKEQYSEKLTNLTTSINSLMVTLDDSNAMLAKLDDLGLDEKYNSYLKLRLNTLVQSLNEKILSVNIAKNENLLAVIQKTKGGIPNIASSFV